MEQLAIDQIVTARAAAAAGCPAARHRLDALFDHGTFTEYGPLAGRSSDVEDDGPADGLVGGVGELGGRPVVAASYDRAVLDGTQSERNQRKLAKLIYLARVNRWPLVLFVEGDGARPDDPLPPPPVVVTTRGRWDTLDGLAELSGWVPTVAVITGAVRDGHVAQAMLCDLVIGVAGATIGVQPRPVEQYAARGDLDLVAAGPDEALAAVRAYLDYWFDDAGSDASAARPAPSAATIGRIVPDNRRRAYDMRALITAFADDASVLELGRAWAPSMVTALARLEGRAIGIFANQPLSPNAGAIDSAAADKAARFIELCDAYELPLVSFIDNPGYMVGPDAERGGIARHHARPLSALHHRTVPLYSVQVRKAYGLGPYAMSGYGSSRHVPQLRLAWPSVESGGMSLEGAAYLVKRKEIQAAATPQEARAIRDAYAEQMRDVASGVRAGRTYSFDDVLLPEETRPRIAAMLRRTTRTLPAVKKHPIDPR
ncbi:MAG: carboxyl transferase domain-containing protein [Acidimicrobiia bacterium]